MAATATPRKVPQGPTARRAPLALPYDWPILALFAGFPVWWFLGFGAFIWPILGVVVAVKLIFRRGLRVPRGFGYWLLFLVWMTGSALMLSPSKIPIAFVFRWVTYLGATALFIWAYNSDPKRFSTSRAVHLLAGFWLMTVAGGWLGVLIPGGQFTSLAEKILPGGLLAQSGFQELVHPAFAQIHDFLGFPVGRPKAPFVYTNTWGSVYALLAPFFFFGWLQSTNPVRRRRGLLILGVSLVPVFVSLNRGLWLGLGVALLNAGSRSGEVGRAARRALVALATLGVLLLAFTPLSTLVEKRAETNHSDSGREYLYSEAIKAANHSPLLGYGGTLKVDSNRILPPVGTQGQFWTVLVGQGWVGAALFELFLIRMWLATRQRGPTVTFWTHASVTVILVTQFTYDLLPVELPVLFLALGIGLRDAHRRDATAPDDMVDGADDALPVPIGSSR